MLFWIILYINFITINSKYLKEFTICDYLSLKLSFNIQQYQIHETDLLNVNLFLFKALQYSNEKYPQTS